MEASSSIAAWTTDLGHYPKIQVNDTADWLRANIAEELIRT